MTLLIIRLTRITLVTVKYIFFRAVWKVTDSHDANIQKKRTNKNSKGHLIILKLLTPSPHERGCFLKRGFSCLRFF